MTRSVCLVGVNEPGYSEDGKMCRQTFDVATSGKVLGSEGERKPTILIHHCEKVFALEFAWGHWFVAARFCGDRFCNID